MFTPDILSSWNPAGLRAALTDADYLREPMEKIGIYRPGEPVARLELANRLLPPDSPLLTACRLFDHDLAVTRTSAEELFGAALDGLFQIGLFEEVAEGKIRSQAKIEVSSEGWFAFDHPSALAAGRADYVMGDGNSSKMLAALATAAMGESVLDLGTGAGWGALRLAERGCRVTATDFNARAIGFARFNAKLAGLEDIEFLVGDRFEPVAGRRFDAIASNPPFVISPENTFIFRDGGVRGDGFCESLARGFGDYLEEGGIAVMILNWFDTGEEEWNRRPLDWTAESGCDVWLFRSDRHEPADYGYRWLRESLQGAAPSPGELDRWTSYYEELGADGINLGFMAMRRRSGAWESDNWRRCDSRSTVKVVNRAGEEIRRVFVNETWLVDHPLSDEELLAVPFAVPGGLQAEATMHLEGGWGMRSIRLRSAGQLSYDGQVDQVIMSLLERCAAGGTPGDLLGEMKARPEYAGAQGLEAGMAGLVRELTRHGLLLPPG